MTRAGDRLIHFSALVRTSGQTPKVTGVLRVSRLLSCPGGEQLLVLRKPEGVESPNHRLLKKCLLDHIVSLTPPLATTELLKTLDHRGSTDKSLCTLECLLGDTAGIFRSTTLKQVTLWSTVGSGRLVITSLRGQHRQDKMLARPSAQESRGHTRSSLQPERQNKD